MHKHILLLLKTTHTIDKEAFETLWELVYYNKTQNNMYFILPFINDKVTVITVSFKASFVSW
jgi:hypothetical protein